MPRSGIESGTSGNSDIAMTTTPSAHGDRKVNDTQGISLYSESEGGYKMKYPRVTCFSPPNLCRLFGVYVMKANCQSFCVLKNVVKTLIGHNFSVCGPIFKILFPLKAEYIAE